MFTSPPPISPPITYAAAVAIRDVADVGRELSPQILHSKEEDSKMSNMQRTLLCLVTEEVLLACICTPNENFHFWIILETPVLPFGKKSPNRDPNPFKPRT